jgi:DNA-binding response OmpR family regulator
MDTAMLVEPQAQRKRFISDLLEKEGLRVESFDTAEEAIGQVEKVAPYVVIMDVQMASRSGLEVLERLKSSNVPVLLLTSRHAIAMRHDLYAVGDVVSAPLANDELRARIRGLLTRQRRMPGVGRGRQAVSQSVASHVLPELHARSSGRLDARNIAEYLGIALSSFARLSEISVAGLHKSPASVSLQRVLIPVARSLTILAQLLGSKEQVRTWMNSPHPDLGGRTPMSLVMEGKARAVRDMLESALAGQPS